MFKMRNEEDEKKKLDKEMKSFEEKFNSLVTSGRNSTGNQPNRKAEFEI